MTRLDGQINFESSVLNHGEDKKLNTTKCVERESMFLNNSQFVLHVAARRVVVLCLIVRPSGKRFLF